MQTRFAAVTLLFAALLMLAGPGAAMAQAPGQFSKDQVDSGRDSFNEYCSDCHRKNLSGDAGPALVGKGFVKEWSKQTVADLFNFVLGAMPPCNAGQLPDNYYRDMVAYLLWANGASPGAQELDAKSTASIGAVVTGVTRPEITAIK